MFNLEPNKMSSPKESIYVPLYFWFNDIKLQTAPPDHHYVLYIRQPTGEERTVFVNAVPDMAVPGMVLYGTYMTWELKRNE